ncbi:PH domain-containing protein [Hymenobacter sp. 5516J-16]|uniref:PH domain-containing protein n=1 Tax=Hymenobacter sp. 5516J-16 TaxID=2932253 RepID=UPI001FD3E539|nr:PH domain-containing protein [Hymenobacter sp. 5516J-16]UOQ77648.1 PH domain-containing protein [Hymenobacter sp. 5516J-16]
MNQVFKSNISWWLFGPILGGLGSFLLLAVVQQRWVASLVVLVPVCFIIYLLLSTAYTITPQELIITSGPLRLAGQDSTSIYSTHTPISSPALSLVDRLAIRYGKFDSVLVSPAAKAGFLAALLQLNPAIRHD